MSDYIADITDTFSGRNSFIVAGNVRTAKDPEVVHRWNAEITFKARPLDLEAAIKTAIEAVLSRKGDPATVTDNKLIIGLAKSI